jgi:5-methyltetrahydrofolate--homocysteine methyltransferase
MEVIDPVTGERRTVEGTPEQIEALAKLAHLVEKGNNKDVPAATEKALEVGISAYEVLTNGLQAGLAVVGERFKRQEAFIPEVLVTARAMKAGVDLLKPLLAPADSKPIGTCVLGTVKGDLHDIGLNLVGIMLEGAGFKIYNCGVNVTPEVFLEKVKDLDADLMGMSALLATTMLNQRTIIEHFKEHGVRDKVRIVCGGAPVTAQFANEIGADGYASDALAAVEVAKLLIREGWKGGFVDGDELGSVQAA